MSIRSSSASSDPNFTLHPQLEKDCALIGDLPLCRVLLMNHRAFPWLILVPRREGLREIFDLGDDYAAVMEEIRHAARQFAALTGAHKINIAALGNIVPQLHIHIIARFESDAAWPVPVWGIPPQPYSFEEIINITEKIRQALNITKM